ncbi:MAG: nucleotidyltransferase family protein [Candidatus Bathyarchaeia archaeon]
MKLVRQLKSSLSEIVASIKTVDGVIGIVLFGSFARGEADEGSDIDLLVLFEDEDKMRRNEWEVTRRIAPSIFAQSICVCPSLLKKMNPVFVQSVLNEGIILYMRYPWMLRSRLANVVSFLLVTYSLRGLSQKEKQKVDYKLFGRVIGSRSYLGLVEKCGGKRLGRGCFLIPKENAETVLNFLDEHNVGYEFSEAYISDETQTSGDLLAMKEESHGYF